MTDNNSDSIGQGLGASANAETGSRERGQEVVPALSGLDPARVEDTYEVEGPKCPYCGRQYTADEACYFDEQNYTEETCDDCGLTFDVNVYTSTTWACSPRSAIAMEAATAGETCNRLDPKDGSAGRRHRPNAVETKSEGSQ